MFYAELVILPVSFDTKLNLTAFSYRNICDSAADGCESPIVLKRNRTGEFPVPLRSDFQTAPLESPPITPSLITAQRSKFP